MPNRRFKKQITAANLVNAIKDGLINRRVLINQANAAQRPLDELIKFTCRRTFTSADTTRGQLYVSRRYKSKHFPCNRIRVAFSGN